ncbi:hypothetical protein HanIR_Chr01g0043971 [Helianthus annuus]|nr:hypothetical protein HanIR_Chr01g0043971 [Helianthus annuus]
MHIVVVHGAWGVFQKKKKNSPSSPLFSVSQHIPVFLTCSFIYFNHRPEITCLHSCCCLHINTQQIERGVRETK